MWRALSRASPWRWVTPAARRIHTDETRALVADERAVLAALGRAVSTTGSAHRGVVAEPLAPLVDASEAAALAGAAEHLEDPFMLVVVGEFNAGKSSLINKLLGGAWLREGVTPTTHEIAVIGCGPHYSETRVEKDVVRLTVPSPWLRDVCIVDTPGTNAVIARHERVTRAFVPRADLVVFLTSVDRPFSQSERAFLTAIAEWAKRVVVAVNKIDAVDEPAERAQVVDYVRVNAARVLGLEPPCFALSLRAQQSGAPHEGFVALRAHIEQTLGSVDRLLLKLRTPLGVARRVLGSAEHALTLRRQRVETDARSLALLDELQAHHRARTALAFPAQLAKLANATFAAREAADSLVAEHVGVGSVVSMALGARSLADRYDRLVVDPLAAALTSHLRAIAGWAEAQDSTWLLEADGFVSAVEPTHLRVRARPMLAAPQRSLASALAALEQSLAQARIGAQLAASAESAALRMFALQASLLGSGMAVGLLSELPLVLPVLAGALLAGSAVGLLTRRRVRLARLVHATLESVRAASVAAATEHTASQAAAAAAVLAARAGPYKVYVAQRQEAQARVAADLAAVRKRLDELDARVERLRLSDGQSAM